MKFRVGMMVRVTGGPRKGMVTVVTSDLKPCEPNPSATWLEPGEPVHRIDAPSLLGRGPAVAPPRWLEPYHEPGDHASLEELLRSVKSEPVKESV